MMSRSMKPIVFVVIALLMATLACSLPGAGKSTPKAKQTPTIGTQMGTTATKAPAQSGGANTPTTAPQGGEAVPAGEVGSISDLNQGMDTLKSYRMQYVYAFDGKDDQGNPSKGSITSTQEVINGSTDSHVSYEATGDAASSGNAGKIEMYQIGKDSYMISADEQGKEQCAAFSSGDQSNPQDTLFKPSDFLDGVTDARLVKKGETVNGVKADHYTFDQTNMPSSGYTAASGDLWIAQDGGYMVKYVGKSTGSSSIFAAGKDVGEITWDYNLTDINAITEIKPPENCAAPGLSSDIPMPPNTTVDSSFSGLTTLKSTDDTKTVADFYRSTMPSQGWKIDSDNALGDMVMLSLTKADRQLSIVITKEDAGGTSIIITDSTGAGQ
jgi:hypothetical protein